MISQKYSSVDGVFPLVKLFEQKEYKWLKLYSDIYIHFQSDDRSELYLYEWVKCHSAALMFKLLNEWKIKWNWAASKSYQLCTPNMLQYQF